VRFINRRRFLRVPVNRPAFIALFPFAKTAATESGSDKEHPETEQNLTAVSDGGWTGPKFIPAVVTELAGPGLRLEAPLEVKVGDRVLVVFKLDEEKDQDSALQESGGLQTSRIAQDIGEVRHTRAIQDGFSVAVELVGLSESDVDELVRATNAASLKAGDVAQDIPDSENVQEPVNEPATVEGV